MRSSICHLGGHHGFYLGTSILSVFYFKSPFRVPILMNMVQWALDVASLLHIRSLRLLKWVGPPVNQLPYSISIELLMLRVNRKWKDMEHDAVIQAVHPWTAMQPWALPLAILHSLKWLTKQSTNRSVTNVVAEAASSLLREKDIKATFALPPNFGSDLIPGAKWRSLLCFRYSELLLTCISSLEARIATGDSGYDPTNVHIATWESLIQIIFEAASDGYPIGMKTWPRFRIADLLDNIALCERILDWSRIHSEADGELVQLSRNIALVGGAAGARALLRKFPHILHESVVYGSTFFHNAAREGNMRVVAVILEDSPSIISLRDVHDKTAVEHAAWGEAFDMVDFLLERGAERPPHLLHEMIRERPFTQALQLLERGWSPFLKDGSGKTALEIANRFYRFEQATLRHPDEPVEVGERRIRELKDLLDKMKLIEGEIHDLD
ncbi:hypothetical protein DXG01_017056, partial [Tephrocybe rancida]